MEPDRHQRPVIPEQHCLCLVNRLRGVGWDRRRVRSSKPSGGIGSWHSFKLKASEPFSLNCITPSFVWPWARPEISPTQQTCLGQEV